MSDRDELRELLAELLADVSTGARVAVMLVAAAGGGEDVLRAAAAGLCAERARLGAAVLADLLVRRTRGGIREVPDDDDVVALVAAAEVQLLAARDVARELPEPVAKAAAANLAATYRSQRSRHLAGASGLN